jgi:uncharacterized protein YbjT (DUF2867 family)
VTILVTGATGSVGRLVVDQLLAAGATDVRALTNKPEKAALPAEVEVVKGYIGRPETLPPALDGVDRMYLAPLVETVHEVLALAKQAGVEHVVDLAGPEGNWWHPIEVAVRDAYPGSANAPIATDDIAAVAAVALVEDGHIGQAYELTGPETLTRADMVRCIGAAIGRDIPYVELSREQAVEELSKAMGEYADWYLEGKAAFLEHPQRAVATVAEVTGRPATTFAQWAVEHAAEFRPS